MSELDAILNNPPDNFGDCDKCQTWGPLWLDPDTEDLGEFYYCKKCWKATIANREERAELNRIRTSFKTISKKRTENNK